MIVTLDLPDNIAEALAGQNGGDLTRRALEALAVDGYRDGHLTQKQVGELLRLSRTETEDFLAAHLPLYDYDPSELTRESELLKNFDNDSH